MGSRSASSLSVDVFVQTPIRSAVLHDVSTQLPLTEFFIGCIFSNDPLDRQNLVRQPPPSVQGPRALLQPPPGLEQLAPPPDLAASSHLHTTHGASTISYPSHAPHPPVCTTQVGTHPVRSATTAIRSASTALAGTHNPVGADPRTGTGPFPKASRRGAPAWELRCWALRCRFVRRAPPSFHDVAVHALSCMRRTTHVLLCTIENFHGPPRIASSTSCVTKARVSSNKWTCSNVYLLHRLMLSCRVFDTRDEAAKLVANRPTGDGRANHSHPDPSSASMADVMEST